MITHADSKIIPNNFDSSNIYTGTPSLFNSLDNNTQQEIRDEDLLVNDSMASQNKAI